MADSGPAWCQLSTGSGANPLGSVTTPVDSTVRKRQECWQLVSDPGKAWVRKQFVSAAGNLRVISSTYEADRLKRSPSSRFLSLSGSFSLSFFHPFFISPSSLRHPSFLSPFLPPFSLPLFLSLCVYVSHSFTLSRHTDAKPTPNPNVHGRSLVSTAGMHGNNCI